MKVCSNLIEQLEKLGAAESEGWYFIEREDDYNSEDYCYDCAEKLAKEDDVICDATAQDSDTIVSCRECGKFLSFYFTIEGVEEELEYFETNPPLLDDNDERRCLINLLEGVKHLEPESSLPVKEGIDIFNRVVAVVNKYLIEVKQ